VGITAILSLQTDEDLGQRGIEWERRAAVAANLTFRSMLVKDFDTADCVVLLDRMLKAATRSVSTARREQAAHPPCGRLSALVLAWPLEQRLPLLCQQCAAPGSNDHSAQVSRVGIFIKSAQDATRTMRAMWKRDPGGHWEDYAQHAASSSGN